MEAQMDEMEVKLTKNGKRRWSVEQKLNILKELESGVHYAELCRKYNISNQLLYTWKRRMQGSGKEGLKYEGGVVPRSQYLTAVKRIEELERVLGRKSLENDILKKVFEIKGIKLPEER
jgi:transposase